MEQKPANVVRLYDLRGKLEEMRSKGFSGPEFDMMDRIINGDPKNMPNLLDVNVLKNQENIRGIFEKKGMSPEEIEEKLDILRRDLVFLGPKREDGIRRFTYADRKLTVDVQDREHPDGRPVQFDGIPALLDYLEDTLRRMPPTPPNALKKSTSDKKPNIRPARTLAAELDPPGSRIPDRGGRY